MSKRRSYGDISKMLRPCECCTLEWRAVDGDLRMIDVSRYDAETIGGYAAFWKMLIGMDIAPKPK